MWSRSTKQRRAAMRRKLRDSPLARWIANAGPGEFFTLPTEWVPLSQRYPEFFPRTTAERLFRTLAYAETPKETK